MGIKNVSTFVTAKQRGALVQLVRMPPCHGGGHGFESHTHRKTKESPNGGSLFLRRVAHISEAANSGFFLFYGEVEVGVGVGFFF